MIPRQALLTWVALGCSSLCAHAQLNHRITPSFATRHVYPIVQDNGNMVYVCERKFNYDSSRVELLFTAPDFSLTSAVSYRLQTPLTLLQHATGLSDGFLLSGITYSSFPFLLKTGTDGSVQWYYWMDNLPDFQDGIAQVVPRGAEFTAYSSKSGPTNHSVCRIEGNSTGTVWSGARMFAPTGVSFKVMEARATADPMEQVLGGTSFLDADPYDRKAMIMRTNASGALWMKWYEIAPSSIAQSEEIYSIKPTADGNYIAAGYVNTTATNYEGFVLKFDPNGGVIWCKRYADASGGLFLSAIIELQGGNLLVAGEDFYYMGMAIVLSPTGDVVQASRFQPPDGSILLTEDLMRDGNGNIRLMTDERVIAFNEMGESCDFLNVSTVTAQVLVPTVTEQPITNAPFTPTTQSMNTFVRTPDISWVQTCVVDALPEPGAGEGDLRAFPNPTDDLVLLGTPGQVRPDERVRVLDATGRHVFTGRYGAGIDLRGMTPGAYTCLLVDHGIHLRVMRR